MNKYLLKKFCAVVVCLLASVVIIGASAIVSHNFTVASEAASPTRPGERPQSNGDNSQTADNTTSNQPTRTAPPDFNMLVLGLDDGGFLPDVIMVLMFNGETNGINIISIPRDTLIIMGDDEWAMFEEVGRANRPPSHGWVKINEMHSFASLQHGARFLTSHLESQLGIDIDFYVTIGMNAFTYIVDAIGGVYLEVPWPGMFYNEDDGTIAINLQPGWQRLSGFQSEQFVRYRDTLIRGDLDRIENQQIFMRAFFEQALTNEAITSNLMSYASIFINQVRTNWGIPQTFRYIDVVTNLNQDSIAFHTLPGESVRIPNPFGTFYWYVQADWAEARAIIAGFNADDSGGNE